MDMNIQNLPVVNTYNVVTDTSITNARHAYNLLQKNKLMSEFRSIRATREKIEILCNKELDGVIPSLFTSALNYPDPVERAVFSLVLCQYAKSKMMSALEDVSKTDEIQAEIDKLVEDFSDKYKDYLQVKDYPTTIKSSGFNPSVAVKRDENGRLIPTFSAGGCTNTITSNEDLTNSLRKLERVYLDAKELYEKIQQYADFNNIILNDESIKDFADNSSRIAKPVARNIEDESSRKILSKWIRYAFSFKGDWASEETVLSISKLS